MNQRADLSIEALAQRVTGRSMSLLHADLAQHGAAMRAAVAGRRVLVIGGAGSIGSATVRELVPLQPAQLVVVDHDENGLVELVRDLRSGAGLGGVDLRTLPLDFGSGVLRQHLAAEPSFDLVLNFAALKHVRSEKDRASLLQMLDTNLLKGERLLEALRQIGFRGRFFCVSTDKAANPVNLMGASKRLMERLVFRSGALPGAVVTSARFANVAFSAGSLLAGFLQRLAKRQPLAVPCATRRYFVTPAEAGQLCALAATVAPAAHVVVPTLAAERDLVLLEDVAAAVVEAHGHRPRFHDDEAALRAAFAADLAAGTYGILRTPLDTAGEKPFEEFVGAGERTSDIGLQALAAVAMAPVAEPALLDLVAALAAEVAAERAGRSLDDWVAAVAAVTPGFVHQQSRWHLDQRM